MSIDDLAHRYAETVAMRDRILTEHVPGSERQRALDRANSTVWNAERALADEIGRAALSPVDDRPGVERETPSAWLVAIGREALELDRDGLRRVEPPLEDDPAASNIIFNS